MSLSKMKDTIVKLENGNSKSKSERLNIRCPLLLYKKLYYYMKEVGETNKSQVMLELLDVGIDYMITKD